MPQYLRPILDRGLLQADPGGAQGGDADPALLAELALLLDGRRTLHEVIGLMIGGGHEIEPVMMALDQLEQRGALQEAASAAQQLTAEERARYSPQLQLFAAFGQPAGAPQAELEAGTAAQLALKQALVVLVDSGSAGRQLLQLLAQLGVGYLAMIGTPDALDTIDGAEPIATTLRRINPDVVFLNVGMAEMAPAALREARPDLLIYCPDRFDAARCAQINALCLEQSIPWLPLRRRRLAIEIGPLVLPGETACYRCYELRYAAAGSAQGDLEDVQSAGPAFPSGVEWLALDAVKQLTTIAEPVSRGRLWRLNLTSGQTETHTVLKLPRCPACGVHMRRPLRKLWEE